MSLCTKQKFIEKRKNEFLPRPTLYDLIVFTLLTFNLQAPGKYVSFIHVSVLNCPYVGD